MNIHIPAPRSSRKERSRFEQEVFAQMPALLKYCLYLTRDPNKAEDLAQETFARAWAARERFTFGAGMRAWLCTIALNYHRLQKRHDKYFGTWVEGMDEPMQSPYLNIPEPEAVAEVKCLLRCLACLSRKQSHAVIASIFLDLPSPEAAQLLGCTATAMRINLLRAREAIAKMSNLDGNRPRPDLSWQRSATQTVYETDPAHPLGRAYEALYGSL